MQTTFDISFNNYRASQIEINRVVNDPRGPVIPHLRKVGRTIVAAARAQVGKDTGDLARSIEFNIQRFGGLPELWIGTYNKIAYLHHEGSRPHAISARNGQFLRFSVRGRMVYARTVMHPGTRPNRFLTDNIYLARI